MWGLFGTVSGGSRPHVNSPRKESRPISSGDMSNFHGWPEQQVYAGADGARTFLREWMDAWEDWELEIDALHDAGERVVALLRQRGTSKAAGMPVEMFFAQVWTLRDGKEARMDMYSDPDEALEAAGLRE